MLLDGSFTSTDVDLQVAINLNGKVNVVQATQPYAQPPTVVTILPQTQAMLSTVEIDDSELRGRTWMLRYTAAEMNPVRPEAPPPTQSHERAPEPPHMFEMAPSPQQNPPP